MLNKNNNATNIERTNLFFSRIGIILNISLLIYFITTFFYSIYYREYFSNIFLINWHREGEFYKEMLENGFKYQKYDGFYFEDERTWITGNANIIIAPFDEKTFTHFSLTGFLGGHMTKNSITVTINNKESVTVDMIPENSFSVEMDFENTPDNIIYVNFKTQKTFVPKDEGWNDDTRELGAMITSWSLSDEMSLSKYTYSIKDTHVTFPKRVIQKLKSLKFARKLKSLYSFLKNP